MANLGYLPVLRIRIGNRIQGSETFGRIRIRSGTEINIDSISDPKPDPK